MKANLYWCTTECHSEDWFILARTLKEARRTFEDFEGFDYGDATAELICEIDDFPDDPKDRDRTNFPDYAQVDDLEKLGFDIHEEEPPRVVEYKGRFFEEGQAGAFIDLFHSQNPSLN